MNSEYNPPRSISHTQHENPFRTKHTITSPNFFDVDKMSNVYITNHKKNNIYFSSSVILN